MDVDRGVSVAGSAWWPSLGRAALGEIKNPAEPAEQGRDTVTGTVGVDGQRPCGIRAGKDAKANRGVGRTNVIAAMRLMNDDA
jgi:hypothetical protein